MIKFVDKFLDGITMYRLTFYYLLFLILIAVVFSFIGVLPFNPIGLLFSAAFITFVCWVTNTIFAKVFKVPTNLESVYITAFILALIITPIAHFQDLFSYFWVGVLAVSSKYILAINKKHLFNPAAFAVALTAFALNFPASWWVGTPWMMPMVLLGGLLVVRKIRRFNMVITFLTISLIVILGASFLRGSNVVLVFQKAILETPILFFAFIMFTEPQTTPPTKTLRTIYGFLVGLLFAPPVHIASFYFTPETALILGNVFSYIVSPKEKLLLELKEKIQLTQDIYDFVFKQDRKLNFLPGQYMEWTLSHPNPDSRGTRRFLTIASSPTEEDLRIGIKFYPNGSSFKKSLVSLAPGSKLLAGQLAGGFTLPKDQTKKLVFIAGGIGVTPYRSIIKYLLDINQRRDIILFYSNKTESDIVYRDIFDKAWQNLGIKTFYVVTDKVGFLNEAMIKANVLDFKDRIFYISGPHSMVDAFKNTLRQMGISNKQIKVDFFPGYA